MMKPLSIEPPSLPLPNGLYPSNEMSKTSPLQMMQDGLMRSYTVGMNGGRNQCLSSRLRLQSSQHLLYRPALTVKKLRAHTVLKCALELAPCLARHKLLGSLGGQNKVV